MNTGSSKIIKLKFDTGIPIDIFLQFDYTRLAIVTILSAILNESKPKHVPNTVPGTGEYIYVLHIQIFYSLQYMAEM